MKGHDNSIGACYKYKLMTATYYKYQSVLQMQIGLVRVLGSERVLNIISSHRPG
jgi:hypothetical protein